MKDVPAFSKPFKDNFAKVNKFQSNGDNGFGDQGENKFACDTIPSPYQLTTNNMTKIYQQ